MMLIFGERMLALLLSKRIYNISIIILADTVNVPSDRGAILQWPITRCLGNGVFSDPSFLIYSLDQ
jgi:hypothetical protein